MDAATTPPLRIHTSRSQGVSPLTARARLHDFLEAYEHRSMMSNGGDTTVSRHLRTLMDALHAEGDVRKKIREA
ncbi:hypothetical protein AcV5_009180 [Taiwanofungus camphoratus]|nr:hypothetical protein AcV5_009180 [Antrodia cinnamomea]